MASSSEDQVQYTLPPTAPDVDVPRAGLPEAPSTSEDDLRQSAKALSAQWEMVPESEASEGLATRLKKLKTRLVDVLRACLPGAPSQVLTPQLELLESTRMLEAVLQGAESAQEKLSRLPRVRVGRNENLPRVMNLAEGYICSAGGVWSRDSLGIYLHQVQLHDPLLLNEITYLPLALNLAQLEFILDRAEEAFAAGELPPIERSPFSAILHSLRRLNQVEWRAVLEPLIAFDPILRTDPSGAFARMEDETRNAYHLRVAELACHADYSETQVAQAAIDLALEASREAHSDHRYLRRIAHVGYYLFAEGLPALAHRIGYHPPQIDRLRSLLRRWNEDFYILGIFTLSLALIVAVIAPLVPHHAIWPVVGALILALLPATQGAVDLVNSSVLSLLKAEALPKLDYSGGVPVEASTLVVVPTLLINEKQVRDLFDQLEVRYLSNPDRNIHFGMLTDLPDASAQPLSEAHDPIVEFAIRCTNELNAKYPRDKGGAFVLLHRYRVFNSRQGVWMGWERKRGKLLDLNKFLLREYDSFPVKAGPVELLHDIRYVITLDSDTQLPRTAAARMIGTMAHPLNQAIVNPRHRIVTAGYGILQPRVGISVASASRSRLASLYSGETGFDIYTRAVSDVYQDLFGEGIFAGKGIYEVGIFHQVLDRRFPRNSLLSHDLIEGAYVRAGLVTDIEVIDDYPSRYSAHVRRRHRWVRGDWQIAQWLFGRVPDETGRWVQNPISTISRWKILDNLRRSLVEPVTLVMLVLGWFILPGGAAYWTAVTFLLLLLPRLVQLGFDLGRALVKISPIATRDAVFTFVTSSGFTLLNLTFLLNDTLLSVDAIVRSLVRKFVSGKRLLEWETAAEAESGQSQTPLDLYLRLSPLFPLLVAIILFLTNHNSLAAAGPVLVLWACAPLVALWLDAPPQDAEGALALADRVFLLKQALYLWRYFLEFGDERNHWLIPDNVEEENTLQVRKLSPTNLGMLINSRQAALEFGFITLPQFVRATLGTLSTYDRLEKQRGHIYNWYNIETLQPIAPLTVSAVDSGNLAASLYTLHGGALDLLKSPLLELDTFSKLEEMSSLLDASKNHRNDSIASSQLRSSVAAGLRGRIRCFVERSSTPSSSQVSSQSISGYTAEDWAAIEITQRQAALLRFIEEYSPWLLPQFEPLFTLNHLDESADIQAPSIRTAPDYVAGLETRLSTAATLLDTSSPLLSLATQLQSLLPVAQQKLMELRDDLMTIAAKAEQFADAMEFGFMYIEARQLLSIGYDAATGEVHSACYDLLASEARIASFLAVAKGDIPQQSWFRLDRSHVLVDDRPALLSWTGTMFEYMMPALWMRSFPNTLISRSLDAVAQIQKTHVKNIPWGISESGFAKKDPAGRYGYQAWGIPGLALKYGAEDGPVISPYSTFLVLPVLRKQAIDNLIRMLSMGWLGRYGFYEAADYTQGGSPGIVRSWMAHHQGMSLLAVTNLLRDNIVQRWFHANPRVRAAELLLHEKPLSKETLKALSNRTKNDTERGSNVEATA